MSDDQRDLSSQPGKILKTAREELGLSIERVADELHLRASVVESMEQEDYDSFDSDVFLKGYYRSYCRLVNLHEERMIELLEAQLGDREKTRQEAIARERQIEKARSRKKVIKSLVLLGTLTVIVVASLTLLVPGEEPLKGSAGADEESTLVMDEVPSDASDFQNSENESGQELRTEEGSETEPEMEMKAEDPDSGDDESSREVTEAINYVSDEMYTEPAQDEALSARPQSVAIETEPTQSQSMPAVEVGPDQSVIEVVFIGDCWFQLKNGLGKTVIADLKRSGEVVNYEGAAPFSLVLGDARQAALTFNGQEVDLLPFTASNGRAQMTLSPES